MEEQPQSILSMEHHCSTYRIDPPMASSNYYFQNIFFSTNYFATFSILAAPSPYGILLILLHSRQLFPHYTFVQFKNL